MLDRVVCIASASIESRPSIFDWAGDVSLGTGSGDSGSNPGA
jgi:hypothetical protein